MPTFEVRLHWLWLDTLKSEVCPYFMWATPGEEACVVLHVDRVVDGISRAGDPCPTCEGRGFGVAVVCGNCKGEGAREVRLSSML